MANQQPIFTPPRTRKSRTTKLKISRKNKIINKIKNRKTTEKSVSLRVVSFIFKNHSLLLNIFISCTGDFIVTFPQILRTYLGWVHLPHHSPSSCSPYLE
jgi:hypothetical protein